MTQLVPEFPGVAKYPIDAWEAMGKPKLTTSGWNAMCMCIAQKDMEGLQGVFDVAERIEATQAKKAASDASARDGAGLQCGYAGEPTSYAVSSIASAAGESGHEVDLR